MTILLFLLDGFTSFDIKNQTLKSFAYIGFLIQTPIILIWNYFVIKTTNSRIIGTIYPMMFLILIFVLNPMKILSSSNAWRTQTIIYQNRHLSFKTIEFQMQDVGARGYNRRKVEVLYLTPMFTITSEIPSDIGQRIEWEKVEKDINELGLK